MAINGFFLENLSFENFYPDYIHENNSEHTTTLKLKEKLKAYSWRIMVTANNDATPFVAPDFKDVVICTSFCLGWNDQNDMSRIDSIVRSYNSVNLVSVLHLSCQINKTIQDLVCELLELTRTRHSEQIDHYRKITSLGLQASYLKMSPKSCNCLVCSTCSVCC